MALSSIRPRCWFQLAAVLFLVGCDPGRALETGPPESSDHQIAGAVLDAASSVGIASAVVEFDGVAKGTTSLDGSFRFGNTHDLVRQSRSVVRVSAPGYAPAVLELQRVQGAVLLPTIRLAALSSPMPGSPDRGTLEFANGVHVRIPAGALPVAAALRSALDVPVSMAQRWSATREIVRAAVHISADATRFEHPLHVTVPLKMPPTSGVPLRVYAFDSASDEWQPAGTALAGSEGWTADFVMEDPGTFVIVTDESTTTGTITYSYFTDDWSAWSECESGTRTITRDAFTYSQNFMGAHSGHYKLVDFFKTLSQQYAPNLSAGALSVQVIDAAPLRSRYRSGKSWRTEREDASVSYQNGTKGWYWYSHVQFVGWELSGETCDEPDPQGGGG